MNTLEDFVRSHIKQILIIEIAVLAAGLLWAYAAAGISVSNAVGTVIRSSVLTPFPGIVLVIITGISSVTSSIYLQENRKALKRLALSMAALFLTSIPFLVYFNFIYSSSEVISAITYTTYPYAVQSGIPLMLSGFLLYVIGLMELYYRRINSRPLFPHRLKHS